jgi:outer membrane protein
MMNEFKWFNEEGPVSRKPGQPKDRLKGALFFVCLGLVVLSLLAAGPLVASDSFFPMELYQGSVVGLGIGVYPDYMGSNDYVVGVAPFVRLPFWGERYVSLIANELRVNILDDAHWRLGPSLVYRFGRKDVEDDVVKKVHEVDASLDVGAFAGYDWYEKREPLKRIGVSGFFQADTTNSYGGWTAGAQLYGSYPVFKPLTLMAGLGTTYGSGSYMDAYFGVTPADSLSSGLKPYEAGAGFRDARGWVTAMFHFNPQWHLGMGVMYSGLFDEAGNSPIVSDRGSRNQWVYGPVGLFTW